MSLMLLCGAGVLVSLGAAARWRSATYVEGWAAAASGGPAPGSLAAVISSVVRQAALTVMTAVLVGLLFVGPVSRLIMRLLAVTAGDSARGRITEADEVVGAITAGGTFGLIIFVGLSGGLIVALAWTLLRPVLPAGVGGGALLGGILLVVVGPLSDPIRADNPDFGLVGPGWVALLTFGLAAVATGALVAVVHARLSMAVPLPGRRPPRAWLPYAPVAVLLLPGLGPGLVVLAAVALSALLHHLGVLPLSERGQHRLLVAGRAVVGVAALAATPTFVSAVAHIAGT